MKVLSWMKEHAAITASLCLNVGFTAAIVWQAHIIQQQREVIVQLYFLLKLFFGAQSQA